MKTMRTERARRGGGRGFTLIEILVVIGIIVVLVGIVVAVGTQMKFKAQIARTKMTLKTLDGILQTYEQETGGTWPTTAGQTDFVVQFSALPATRRMLATMEKSSQSGSGANLQIIDGFGTPIEYRLNGPGGRPYFMSYGPDAMSSKPEQQKDDIYSYEP